MVIGPKNVNIIQNKQMEFLMSENAKLSEQISHLTYQLKEISENVIEVKKKDNSEFPSGDYLNPTAWEPGMQIQAGTNEDYVSDGWYILGGLTQRCIKSGAPETFDDKEFWEVI